MRLTGERRHKRFSVLCSGTTSVVRVLIALRSWPLGPFSCFCRVEAESISLGFGYTSAVDVIAFAAVFGGVCPLSSIRREAFSHRDRPGARAACRSGKMLCALAAASSDRSPSGSASSPKFSVEPGPAGSRSLGFKFFLCRHPPGPRPPAFRPFHLARSIGPFVNLAPHPPFLFSAGCGQLCPEHHQHSALGSSALAPGPAHRRSGVRFRSGALTGPHQPLQPGGSAAKASGACRR